MDDGLIASDSHHKVTDWLVWSRINLAFTFEGFVSTFTYIVLDWWSLNLKGQSG